MKRISHQNIIFIHTNLFKLSILNIKHQENMSMNLLRFQTAKLTLISRESQEKIDVLKEKASIKIMFKPITKRLYKYREMT